MTKSYIRMHLPPLGGAVYELRVYPDDDGTKTRNVWYYLMEHGIPVDLVTVTESVELGGTKVTL